MKPPKKIARLSNWYEFDKETLTSFGGPHVKTETTEEADELMLVDDKASEIVVEENKSQVTVCCCGENERRDSYGKIKYEAFIARMVENDLLIHLDYRKYDVYMGIGVFTMQEDYPSRSAAVAGNRKYDVYMGFGIFGRGTYGGGQCTLLWCRFDGILAFHAI